METNLFKSINLIRCVSGANLNLFRYAAMVAMLLTLGIGNVWAGGSSHSTHYGKAVLNNATGNGTVYLSTASGSNSGQTGTTGTAGAAGSTSYITWNCGGSSGSDSKTYYARGTANDGYYFAGYATSSTATSYTASTTGWSPTKASSTSSGSPTTSTIYGFFKPVTVTAAPSNVNINATDPSATYNDAAGTVVSFTTANSNKIGDFTTSESGDSKWVISAWTRASASSTTFNYKFVGNGSYGTNNRTFTKTVTLTSKGDASSTKTCTLTAKYPNPRVVACDAEATDLTIYPTFKAADATQEAVEKTAIFDVVYADNANNFSAAFSGATGSGTWAVTGISVDQANQKATVTYTFNGNKSVGTHTAVLTLTAANCQGWDDTSAAGGASATVTLTAENTQEATNDASVTTTANVTTEYATFAQALAAANATSGATLTLLRNVDLGTITATNNITKAMTIDLNGKELRAAVNATSVGILTITKAVAVTIKDSKTGGKIINEIARNSEIRTIFVNKAGATLTLESGTIAVNNLGQYASAANSTLGVAKYASCAARVIHQIAGATVNINGGRVEAIGTREVYGIVQASSAATNAAGTSVLNITGGEIYAEAPYNAYGICAYGKVNMSAGVINTHINTNMVNAYYAADNANNTSNGNGYGIYMQVSVSATASNCYYGTLNMTGGTVNVISDRTKAASLYNYGIHLNAAATGVGAGKTATDGTLSQKACAKASIENATINVHSGTYYSYGINVLGSYNSYDNTYFTVPIKNSTIDVKAYTYTYGVVANCGINSTYGGKYWGDVELTGNTLTAESVTGSTAYGVYVVATTAHIFKDANTTTAPIYFGEYATAAKAVINSGTYTAKTKTSSAYAVCSSTRAKTVYDSESTVIANRKPGGNAEAYPIVIIHGGTFRGETTTSTSRAVSSGGYTTIDGGTFEAFSTTTTAYGLYAVSGKLTASGVTISANATQYAYGALADCAVPSGNTAQTGFAYAGEIELNNCDITATTRTSTEARGVSVNATNKMHTWAGFIADSTSYTSSWAANKNNYAAYYRRVFPCTVAGRDSVGIAIAAKATINGCDIKATAGTTTAYGVYSTATSVPGSADSVASPVVTIKNSKFTVATNGTTTAYGVYAGGPTTIDGCDFTVLPKTTTAYGVYIYDKKTTITNTKFDVKGTTTAYGIYANAAIGSTTGWDYHGEVELGEGNDMTVAATAGNTSHVLTLIAAKRNVASGRFIGDYANAALAHITGGAYKATATGTTSYVLNLSAQQVQGSAVSQPSCTIEGGKFWALASGGTTGVCTTNGVAGNILFKGGVYNVNTTLSKHIPEGYEEVPLASDRPEYTEGYRYEVAEEGFHGIDVCKIGSTKYKSLEEALQVVKSGETIIMIANYIMATPGDYILPSGAKLLVPYSGQTATKETNLEYVEGTSAATLNLKLTFGEGVHLVSQGVIECGAKQTGQGSSELTGQVYGSYGHIYLREGSSITVESGASLYAWGYVTGKGEIILKNGGKSYEMFQFGWYKGGNTTSDINSNKSSYKIFPMTDYSYQNIECPITYYPGSSAYGRVAVKPSSYSSMQTPSAMLVGTADNSMFKMTTAEASANTWVKKVYDPETDITNWIMNSGASISGISMNVGVNVNSADFYLPITSNFRITLNYGEMNINNDVIFLPGSQLIINKEATGILKSGKLLFFYDAEDWFTGLGHVSVQASGWSKAKTCGYYYYPATYSPTWGTTNPRKSVYARDKASLDKGVTPLPDAELFVHGKMIVNGSLYTSGDGNASSIGRNANIHSTNEDAGKIQFNTKVTGSKALYKVCFAIGASEANNSWSDMIYGGQTTAYPAHLTNGDGTYVQSSGTEAGKQYVYVDNQWQCWEENGCYTYDAQNHPYAKPAAYVQLTSDQPDANHLLHDAATGTRNFVWDADCYWWEVVTTPTAEGYYQSINPDYNGKYNYYYYDGSAACWKIKKITITWNINGTTTNYSVGYGTKPEWLGATPTKTSSSSDYVWRWDGWTKGSDATVIANNDLPFVTENTTFTAHFYEKYYEYNITFKNSDGTILDSRNWRAGTTPSYEGTPTKNPTAAETYEFNGTWSPAITKVTGSATYTAQYTATPRAYTITFLNYDMSVLGTAEVVYNGTPSNATYLAAVAPMTEDPYKPDNSAYSFEFAGWKLQGASSNGFAQVKGDQTYVAQFNQTTKKYKVSFVDDDGETVLHYLQLEYGQTPSYTWDNPSKQDAEWTYTFANWDPSEFAQVEGAQTYTAVYNKTKREYTITWKDGDGNTLKTDQVAYGSTPSYSGATPTKASTNDHSYVFNNTWSPAIVAVVGEATYTAQFNETPRQYRVTWDAATNGGTCGTEYTDFSYNAAIGTLPVASKEGHTFNGWFTSATGGTQITTATKVTADVTYHAQFTINKYSFSIGVTPAGYGSVDVASITQIPHGTTVTSSGNTFTVNGTTVTATPTTADAQYTYKFDHWNNVPATATDNVTNIEAVFTRSTNTYTVTWKNGDVTLETDENVAYGATPHYDGATPTKTATAEWTYEFAGWDNEVVAVTGDVTYNATFNQTKNSYEITWLNDDNSLIDKTTVEYGVVPTHADATKANTAEYTYTFTGWDNTPVAVTGAATYKATFSSSKNQYTLTLLSNNDEWGTVTGGGEYDYNSVRTITATPKSGFKFVKWNDDNTNASREVTVTADVTYTATFDYDIANYTVKHWQQNINDDEYTEVVADRQTNLSGTIGAQTNAEAKTYTGFTAQPISQQTIALENTVVNIYYNRATYTISWIVKLNGETVASKEETLRYGATPSFGTDPTKEPDDQWEYSFSGWTPTIEAVTENQTYEGTFDATARTYDVTWNNADGTLIEKEENEYTWGAQPSFPGSSDPEYSDGTSKVYVFRGWKYERTGTEYAKDATLPGVAGEEETYTALYTCKEGPIVVANGNTATISTNTETVSTTVHVGGTLHVAAGQTLNTTTFILEASANASGQIIEDGTIEAEHVYYDLKLNSPRRHWHAFGVPWKVDLAANPLTEVETGRTFVLGNDYDIIWYNTTKRASSGPGAHCWEYVAHHDKTLIPGQGYMIAFTRDVQTIRFVKASGAPIIYNQEVTVSAEGEGNNQGVNALANPMAYHATLNAGPTVGYVHDGGEIGSDGYEEYDIENKSYVVGKTVYIQVQSNTTVAIAQSNAAPISKTLAPARRKAVTDKEYLSLNDYYRISISGATADGGSVYVLPEEGKEDKYVVGHDLAKFGMSTKKAQIWIRRYDANLGLHTIAPIDGEAEFPINLYAPTTGEYTIANAFSPDDEYTAYLTRDGEAIWNLSDSPYTMTFNKGTVTGYGIRLAKKAPQIATGVDEAVVDAKGETRKVLVNDKVFIIRGDQVYSVDGQLVK